MGEQNTIALVKYQSSPESLKEALRLCGAFSTLKPNAKVLIKPNLVTWDPTMKMPPFGVYTSTRLVEDLILALQEHGKHTISIGEGSVAMQGGAGTSEAFKGLGYDRLASQYGVSLVDFNTGGYIKYNASNGMPLFVAKPAVETDFFINMPVLKTHAQTKISLGIKNLKGCLKLASKRLCHDPKYQLEQSFPQIAKFVKPSLTIIDGIYGLERGALFFGTAVRKNVIVASRDMLGADLVAAKSIGYSPQDIEHFKNYAKQMGQSLDLAQYLVLGEKLENNITPLKWDWNWNPTNTGPAAFDKMGIKGVANPKYDDTLCSGCSPVSNMVNIFIMSAFKGQPLPPVEFVHGKKMQARSGFEKTVLIGNCIIRANEKNPNIKQAIKVVGCPPPYDALMVAMKEAGLQIDDKAYEKYLHQISVKYDGKPDFSWDFFR